MKLLLALLPFLGCSAFLGPTSLNRNGVVKSFSSEPTKVTIQSMLKTIWNNGGEQTTDNYTYNVGSGRLSWGDKEIQGFYPATKNTSSEGNFDGESGNPIVDWGGDRLYNSVANEMFMMKIVAKNNIKITVGS
ncbi:MAG: hypothetical protein MJ221_04670, partial [Bacilli bacterium]|nr:hypothetical protein [Bacilli bacterium]